MAGLWIENNGSWTIVPLDGCLKSGAIPEASRNAARCPDQGAFLMVSPVTGQPVLVVGSEAGAYVNGHPLPLGIHVLRDRDEIYLARRRARLYYTGESPARVEPFVEIADRRIRCARCTGEMEAGTPSVRCPRCGLWHHATEEYPCWSYSKTCAGCKHPTDSDSYSWVPEGC